MESVSSKTLVPIARDQLFSCYQMLETLVDVCPNKIWQGVFNEVPFWYQVYHTAYFVDYWLRDSRAGADFPSQHFHPSIPPEFEWVPSLDVYLSRETMRVYLRLIRQKLTRIFSALTDSDLALAAFAQEPQVTLLDAVLSQTRHIMYNVGYCNGILRERGLEEADWYAYNEPVE